MVLFRFHLDASAGYGRVRMKRFGQRCKKCKNDDMSYHVGLCDATQAWKVVQCLLLHILHRCYERRAADYVDDAHYIILVSDVPSGRYGGTEHQRDCCEACAYGECQEKYKKLTKKK